MINYKLAKQLKEAGFPQDTYKEYSVKGYIARATAMWLNQDIYFPTLSELIEACGDRFKCLLSPSAHKMFGSWMAVSVIGTIDKDGIWQGWSFHSGETDQEAVAMLYLSKNEK